MKRHAEIAGGGIGGLGLAIMLARNGWSVRVHERSPIIREIGAAISLRSNCIAVFERYGLFARLEPLGAAMREEQHYDGHGRLLQKRILSGQRNLVISRQTLVDGLATAAREAGVDIVTSSHIVAADPKGSLIDESGRRYDADLAVGADGVHSRVRTALDIKATYRELDTRINRFLVEAPEFATPDTKIEHWSDDRRVGVIPAGGGLSLVYNVMPASDAGACRLPVDVKDWSTVFPRLAGLFQTLSTSQTTQFSYSSVWCPKWVNGSLALIGDAAHGMPPTLGQGAGLTMLNCHALATLVSRADSIPQALEHWERAVRDVTDATQRWSTRYDQITRTRSWPRPLRALRPALIWAFGHFDFLNRRVRVADLGLPMIEARIGRT